MSELEVTITPHYESIPVRGNAMASGDSAYDKEAEDKILEALGSGNIWAWCTVEVVVTLGLMGDDFVSASDFLGCCSYKNEQDFIENSGYYEDMVATCKDELKATLTAWLKELET